MMLNLRRLAGQSIRIEYNTPKTRKMDMHTFIRNIKIKTSNYNHHYIFQKINTRLRIVSKIDAS